jgi:hypothetical protein
MYVIRVDSREWQQKASGGYQFAINVLHFLKTKAIISSMIFHVFPAAASEKTPIDITSKEFHDHPSP